MEEVRLSAIENQLSRMNEKFDSLIRLEVRHESLNSRVDIHADRLNTHSNRIGDLERVATSNSKKLSSYSTAIAAICSGVFLTILYYIAENI